MNWLWLVVGAIAAVLVWMWIKRAKRPANRLEHESALGRSNPPPTPEAQPPPKQALAISVPVLPDGLEERIASALRRGDDARLIEMPTRFHAHHLSVAGESFSNANGTSRQTIIEETEPGTVVYLVPEPDNEHDPEAVRVYVSRGGTATAQIGYLPRGSTDVLDDLRRGDVATWFASKHRSEDGRWGAALYLVRKET